MKIYSLFASLALLTSSLFGFNSLPPPKGLAPVHVRIIWNEDPQHTATISWSTGEKAKVNRLYANKDEHLDTRNHTITQDADINLRGE